MASTNRTGRVSSIDYAAGTTVSLEAGGAVSAEAGGAFGVSAGGKFSLEGQEGLEIEVSGGEAKITLNGAVITVSEAGDVSITSPTKIELTAPEINAEAGTGDVTIQGISLVHHTHTDSLGGSTTPPK